MLEFRKCVVCHESHALRRDGQMSIHTTAAGKRCEEPMKARPERPQRRTPERRPRPQGNERVRSTVMRLGDQSELPKWQRDLELEAAFDAAAEHKRKKRDAGVPKSKPFDRRIYATGGVRTVSGGSPGGGKRR